MPSQLEALADKLSSMESATVTNSAASRDVIAALQTQLAEKEAEKLRVAEDAKVNKSAPIIVLLYLQFCFLFLLQRLADAESLAQARADEVLAERNRLASRIAEVEHDLTSATVCSCMIAHV